MVTTQAGGGVGLGQGLDDGHVADQAQLGSAEGGRPAQAAQARVPQRRHRGRSQRPGDLGVGRGIDEQRPQPGHRGQVGGGVGGGRRGRGRRGHGRDRGINWGKG
jgi:hypothetical protein